MTMVKAYTNIEQSKKMADILPIDSADMFYRDSDSNDVKLMWEHVAPKVTTPCWSLAALLGAIPKGEGKDLSLNFGSYDGGYHPLWFCTYEETPTILEICNADNPIDACVEMILKLKEKDLL